MLKISAKQTNKKITFLGGGMGGEEEAKNLFQLNKNIHFLKRPFSDTIFPIQLMSTSSSYVFQAPGAKHNLSVFEMRTSLFRP